MTFSINTNIMALDAQRSLAITTAKMSKSMQQLSTGMRINSAADDAAGLAISEKMRSQITNMHQGLRNAQDAISMLQTAAGSISQVQAILQRMRQLAVQGASTTLSTNDRTAIGNEVLILRDQLDNIATQTQFNGLNLLTGTLSVTPSGTLTTNTTSAGTTNVTVSVDAGQATAGDTYTLSGTGSALTINDVTAGISQTVTVPDFASPESQIVDFTALGIKLTINADGAITGANIVDTGTNPLKSATLTLTGTGSAGFRTGAPVSDSVNVTFGDLRSSALGSGGGNNLNQLITSDNAVSTTVKADTLLTSVDAAIDQVTSAAARLGAAQNQMQSSVNELGVSVENLTASNSTIRDADIAQTSSNLVAQQILQQAGIAVLQQANMVPQAVLQLLK